MTKKVHWFLVLTLLFTASAYLSAQTISYEDVVSRLNSGISLYGEGRWREAVIELRRVEAEAPVPGLRGEALFWISLAELSAGDYAPALSDMESLEETDPANPRLTELQYHKGRLFFFLNRYDEAIILLKNYADSFLPGTDGRLSQSDAAKKAAALYWIGESLFNMGQLDRAEDVFRMITEDFSGTHKYEASVYRLSIISQKRIEAELLGLLRWSHEESLRGMEEYRQRETSYDQALNAYQRRIAEMLQDTRLFELEESNAHYREQLELAGERIRSLESSLSEAAANAEARTLEDRLNAMRLAAEELERRISGQQRGN